MIAQIFAVVIFVAMFVFIVTEIVERHIVSLVSALLTMIFVFGIGMHSLEAVWQTLNFGSIFSPGFGMQELLVMLARLELIGKPLFLSLA